MSINIPPMEVDSGKSLTPCLTGENLIFSFRPGTVATRKLLPELQQPLNYPECLDRIVQTAVYRAEYECQFKG